MRACLTPGSLPAVRPYLDRALLPRTNDDPHAPILFDDPVLLLDKYGGTFAAVVPFHLVSVNNKLLIPALPPLALHHLRDAI